MSVSSSSSSATQKSLSGQILDNISGYSIKFAQNRITSASNTLGRVVTEIKQDPQSFAMEALKNSGKVVGGILALRVFDVVHNVVSAVVGDGIALCLEIGAVGVTMTYISRSQKAEASEASEAVVAKISHKEFKEIGTDTADESQSISDADPDDQVSEPNIFDDDAIVRNDSIVNN